jgi:hypothetical protein
MYAILLYDKESLMQVYYDELSMLECSHICLSLHPAGNP